MSLASQTISVLVTTSVSRICVQNTSDLETDKRQGGKNNNKTKQNKTKQNKTKQNKKPFWPHPVLSRLAMKKFRKW
jgi:hypothetical protein